jgi:uncharacterized repeat protein (TIGR03803 family)
MIKLNIRVISGALALSFYLSACLPAATQVLRTVFTFDGSNGIAPASMALIQGIDGNYYGTTMRGGEFSSGTVFKLSPSGNESVLYSFCSLPNCADGAGPYAGLVQASDGNFYGTTYQGGLYGYGTVFKVTPAGVLTTLYSFCASGSPCAVDGGEPTGALIQGSDGNLYGTTGGDYFDPIQGTVFKMTLDGALTTLHNFCSQPACEDGEWPYAGLVQGADGNFYGTATNGGNFGQGVIFKMTPTGVLTTIYNFCEQTGCPDGRDPKGGLALGPDGDFYGTTQLGGTTRIEGQGTVYKVTPEGVLTTLHRFCENPIGGFCPDSGLPTVGLALISNGYFAGTTSGAFNSVTLFAVSSKGLFIQTTKANNTTAPLFQGTNGLVYGMANGGTFEEGSVFSLNAGLGPFVRTTTTFGSVGDPVVILGTNLTGTTSVTFNGTAAQFTVLSASEITTTVPAQATTGLIKVETPSRTVASNLPFTVIP